jgi:putative Na+/H+ antiporter
MLSPAVVQGAQLPLPLSAYPPPSPNGLLATLAERAHLEPFNLIATGLFLLAILHTFMAARFMALAHKMEKEHADYERMNRLPPAPIIRAEVVHFLGEVEVVFGLWVVVLLVLMLAFYDWGVSKHYLAEGVNYTEALFVVVIMALAATRPIVLAAESAMRRLAALGGATPAAWWLVILSVGPLLGSVITEPGAMTISALRLSRQFYDHQPSIRLKYATLGLLFVNISIGGTLTHFAAPPVLMVARPWEWDLAYMNTHFGWKAIIAIVISCAVYYLAFARELRELSRRSPAALDAADDLEFADARPSSPAALPIPAWVTLGHVAFMAWTVFNSHYPALFVGGFMFFLGFARATRPYQSAIDLQRPLLVGFFLAGLVIHGGLQGWWIELTLASLTEPPLFHGAMGLTAFNDNALVTYLATLVPSLTEGMRYAVVAGAVTGGGLTVIANAPNPAGQAILGRFFDGSISPAGLFLGASIPTAVASAVFVLL